MLSSKDYLNCQPPRCQHYANNHCSQYMPNAYLAVLEDFSMDTNEQKKLKELYEEGLKKQATIKDFGKVNLCTRFV